MGENGRCILDGVPVRNAVCAGTRIRLAVVSAVDRAVPDLLGDGQKPVSAVEVLA